MLKRDPNQPVDTSKGYEISDVKVSLFFWGIAITFVITIAAFIAMRVMWQAMEFAPSVSGSGTPTTSALRFEQGPPPGPGLQVNLEADLAALVDPQKFMLNNYGWISETEGLVHIPIDAAIDRIVQDGFPRWETEDDAAAMEPVPASDPNTVIVPEPAQPEEAPDAPIAQ